MELRYIPDGCNSTSGWQPKGTDISNEPTRITMSVLAIINIGVIIQGCFSCYHKIKGFPKKTFNIIMFYVLAFLSLATAILYCFSWTLDHGGSRKGD